VNYWWVNQNQTYRQETEGGYLWSPKRKKDGKRNPFYEYMREVSPGDVVFSFADTRISNLGIARSYCYESPKPTEFGAAGKSWSQVGWRVDVEFTRIRTPIRPMNHIAVLADLLPKRYSPLHAETGYGLQSVYLTKVPPSLAMALYRLIGQDASSVQDTAVAVGLAAQAEPPAEAVIEKWEEIEEQNIQANPLLAETERLALVRARRGQGLFRQNVQKIERACRVTLVDRPEHLVASHAKPWRDSNNEERLDGENGLLLTPTMDHLFDKGFISFEDKGRLIVSPVVHTASLRKMGIDPDIPMNVGAFSEGQRVFLQFHRQSILRFADVRGPEDARAARLSAIVR
jgi:putative restriction endonuclease